MPAQEVPLPPGNPAAISIDVKDLGKRLCVPRFHVVCLCQAMVIIGWEFGCLKVWDVSAPLVPTIFLVAEAW
jgi:hypothetical protein